MSLAWGNRKNGEKTTGRRTGERKRGGRLRSRLSAQNGIDCGVQRNSGAPRGGDRGGRVARMNCARESVKSKRIWNIARTRIRKRRRRCGRRGLFAFCWEGTSKKGKETWKGKNETGDGLLLRFLNGFCKGGDTRFLLASSEGRVRPKRAFKYVAPLVSIGRTCFTGLQDNNLLNTRIKRIKRIFIFLPDAKVPQLEVDFDEGAFEHALNVKWLDEAMFDVDRKRGGLETELNLIQIRFQCTFDGPSFSRFIDTVHAVRCEEQREFALCSKWLTDDRCPNSAGTL
jgi:hypothetical protein